MAKLVIDEQYLDELVNEVKNGDHTTITYSCLALIQHSTPLSEVVKPLLEDTFRKGIEFKEGYRCTDGLSESTINKFARIVSEHLLNNCKG